MFIRSFAVASIALLTSVAHAEEPSVSYNASVYSDYVFRGVSQTEEDPALQAGVDLTWGTFYAGAWASNVWYAGDPDTNAEIDIYGGVRRSFGDWTLDVGAIGYLYTNQPDGADYSYAEAKIGVSRSFGAEDRPVTVGLTAYYSPDFFGAAEDEATYVAADLGWRATERLTLGAQVGRQWVSSDFDYTHWSLGGAYTLTDSFSIDLRYHDTDEHDFGPVYDERVVIGLRAAL
jgi:uncharacterized protein (TIGR02001 family)